MRSRILAVLSVVLIAGGLSFAAAQTTTRIKRADEVTPSWTYKGQWYGYMTCSKLLRQGNKATADAIKKCVADGGTYVLGGGGRTDVEPQEECAKYAGEEVLITGLMTSQVYGTGPTSDQSIEGIYAGGDRPATKFEGVRILSVKVMPKEQTEGPAADIGSRVSDSAK